MVDGSTQHTMIRAKLALMIACILWGAAYVVIHYAAAYYPPPEMAVLRFVSAALVMPCLYFMRSRQNTVTLRDLPRIAALSAIGIFFYNLFLNAGEVMVNGATTSFIKMLGPLISTYLALLIFNEKVSRRVFFALVVGFVGVSLILVADVTHVQMGRGFVYIFIATVCGALYTTLQRHFVTRIDPLQFFAWVIWFATLFSMYWWPVTWQHVQTAPLKPTLWIIFNGVFPAAIGYSLWAYGFSHLRVSQGVIFLYLVPVSSLVIEWFCFHELPSWLTLGGGFMIAMSFFMASRQKKTLS